MCGLLNGRRARRGRVRVEAVCVAYSTDGARGATKLALKQFVWLTQRAARGNRVGVEAVFVTHLMSASRATELELKQCV